MAKVAIQKQKSKFVLKSEVKEQMELKRRSESKLHLLYQICEFIRNIFKRKKQPESPS